MHAAHGLDLSRFGKSLASLNLASSIDPIVPLLPTSVEVCNCRKLTNSLIRCQGFLKNERQTALTTAIQKAQLNVRATYLLIIRV